MRWYGKVDFNPATQFSYSTEKNASISFDIDSDSAPVIAFDLDETLLVNSWVEPAHFGPEKCTELVHAWKKWSLPWCVRQSRGFRGQRFIRPLIDRLGDRDRGVALTVILQMRRGALEVLKALRKLGFRLVLVTASARKRVQYLLARIPVLRELLLFQNLLQIICAEDLQGAALSLATPKNNGNRQPMPLNMLENSTKLHHHESPSLAWKTPLLVQSLLGNPIGYDLLVDDNTETRDGFDRHGLSDVLVHVDGMAAPDSALMFDIADEISRRLHYKYEVKACELNSILAELRESEPKSSIWLEDPFYLPLLRKRLELGDSVECLA